MHLSNPPRGTNEMRVGVNDNPLLDGDEVAEGHAAPHASPSLSAHSNVIQYLRSTFAYSHENNVSSYGNYLGIL